MADNLIPEMFGFPNLNDIMFGGENRRMWMGGRSKKEDTIIPIEYA